MEGGQVLDSAGLGRLSSADFCNAIKKLVGCYDLPRLRTPALIVPCSLLRTAVMQLWGGI